MKTQTPDQAHPVEPHGEPARAAAMRWAVRHVAEDKAKAQAVVDATLRDLATDMADPRRAVRPRS